MQIAKLRIPPLSIICLAAFFIIEPTYYLIFMLVSIALHEAGHIIAMKLLDIKISNITLLPLGIDIRTSANLIPYAKQIIVSFAGPFLNLLLFLLLLFLTETDLLLFFAFFNLLYGIFNLLPVKGLDGGMIALNFACCFLSEENAERLLKILSFIFCVLVWMAGIYIFFILNGNISIFALSLFLYASIFLKNKI